MRMRAYHPSKPQRRKTTHCFLPASPSPQRPRQGARQRQDELKDADWALFDTHDLLAAGLQPGQRLVDAVQMRIDRFAEQYGKRYRSAVRCLLTDRAQLTSYLRFPVEHHRRSGTPTPVERTFGETRRRVKVIGRLPGETSCLSLVWAVLDRASRGWRGLTMTPKALRRLQDPRRELLGQPRPSVPQEVIAQTVTTAA